VAPHIFLGDHEFCTISGITHVNLSFYGTVVHEKKILKWPFPIFALLWLSPLWRGLGLHWNKLEFPSCKKCLYQVWLKLARCFILKDSFQYTNVKIVSPLLSHTLTFGDNNLYKLKSALSQIAFICKYEGFWLSGSQGKTISMTSPHFCIFCDYLPFEEDLGPLLVQFKIPFTQGWFGPSFIETDVLVLEKKIFFNINIWKYGFPYCAPPDPRGPWCEQFGIYIISKSCHVNMIYSDSVVLEKKIFKWPHPIFAFLWLSLLWRRPAPLFEQFKIPKT
jgi:hypothetical protein